MYDMSEGWGKAVGIIAAILILVILPLFGVWTGWETAPWN